MTHRLEKPPTKLSHAVIVRVGSRVSASGMLGLTLLFVAHLTSVGDFGRFMFAYTAAMIGGLVVGTGAPARVLRAGHDEVDRVNVPSIYMTHTVLVGSFAGIALACSVWFGASLAVVAGLAFALSDTVQNYAQSHLAGVGSDVAANVLIVTQRALPLVVVLLTWGGPLLGWLAVAFGICAVFAIAAPWPSAASIGGARLRPVWRWDFWSYSLSGTFFTAQVPLVGVLFSPLVLGYFAMATRVIGPVTLLSASVSTVVIPEMVRRMGTEGLRSIYRTYRTFSYAYLALVVAISAPVAWAVVWFLGDKYSPALPLLIGIMIGAGLSGCSQAASALLIACEGAARPTVAIVAGNALALAVIAGIAVTGRPGLLWVAPVLSEAVVLGLMTRAARDALERIP